MPNIDQSEELFRHMAKYQRELDLEDTIEYLDYWMHNRSDEQDKPTKESEQPSFIQRLISLLKGKK